MTEAPPMAIPEHAEYERPFTAAAEIAFIANLRAKNRLAFERYSAIVLSGMRTYGSEVDTAKVQRAVAEMVEGGR